MSMLKNVAWVEKLHRLCEYTLISFKCQSIRSKVHCTNKTLHNESLKNVTVHLGPRVTCAKNMTSYVGPFIKSDEVIFNKQGGKEKRNLASALTSIGGTGGRCLAMNIEMFLNICSPPNAWPVSWQVHWSVTAEYPLVCGLMLKMSLPWKFHDHFSFFAKTHCLEHADFKKLCHQFF